MTPAPPRSANPLRICLILECPGRCLPEDVPDPVARMIAATPDIEYTIHLIGDRKGHAPRSGQDLPPNTSSVTTGHPGGEHDPAQSKPGHGSSRQKGEFLGLVRSFAHAPDIDTRFSALCDASAILRRQPGIFTLADLLQSQSWRQLLVESHQRYAPQVPFVRFHSTVGDLATTVWNLLHTAAGLPGADVYHCLSTGQAGLLGALASRLNRAPLVLGETRDALSEHAEEVRKSTHLATPAGLIAPFDGDLGPLRNLWFGFFELLSRIACSRADCITAPCKDNAATRIKHGASPGRVTVIPNGVDAARFATIARENLQAGPPADGRVTVGCRGPIVPANDIKTLLRTARLVLRTHPETRFLVAGDTDANPGYAAECLALADRLGISQSFEFHRRMDTEEFLRRSDIFIQTCLCEGQPSTLLEASAAGLPVVSTNVGACRETVAEQFPGHPTLGPSGFIMEVADPAGGRLALNQLIANPELRYEHGMNGLRRVQSAHQQQDIADRFRKLYLTLAARPGPCAPAPHRQPAVPDDRLR